MIHAVEYALVRAVDVALSLLPMSTVRRLGAGLGRVVFHLDRRHQRIALGNLAMAFPGRSEDERKALAKQVFAHFGSVLFELLRFGHYSREEMLAAVDFDGDERARTAYEQGRGVLFITGHFGYWEMQAIAHPLVLPPMQLLARPLDNPALHRWLEDTRCMTGNGVIYRKGAVRRVLRALERNEVVAIMIDQHIQNADAVMVDFFNRPAATTSALAALALRTGAPVIPVVALPQPGGRFRMIYDHPVEPPVVEPGHEDEAIRVFTQRCTDVLEMYVRRYPHLWLWMHRRWRDPATGEEAVAGMFPRATSDQDARLTE